MKVLAILIIVVALVIVIVPQFTNCEYGNDNAATKTMTITTISSASTVSYASMSSPMGGAAAAALPYRMMKCFWSARAEIIAGVPLIALGALLFFARRKETTRVLGIVTVVLGALTILIPTSIVGTCANSQMVCNTEMKPTLLIAGGITVALGVATLVFGEMKRESGGAAAA